MVTTLRELLAEKARHANQVERRARRDEWVVSVARLLTQMQQWLHQADPEHVLEVVVVPIEKWEQGIGGYEVASLDIRCDDKTIRVLPIGRDVLHARVKDGNRSTRALGRVDITDGVTRFCLYRFGDKETETWEVTKDDAAPTVLDQNQFERIIQELLS